MGTSNVLKEFRALIWQHPFVACCFLVLFTPPFFPVLRFFFPLLISTALFIVAIVTMGPHLREASIDNEERELKPNLQVEEVWVDKTVQLNQLQEELQHEDASSWQLVTEETVVVGSSGPSSDPTSKESEKKSRWMQLRRIYKEKGSSWIENLFRNENWKGDGINDENVSILQEAFPHRDEEKEQTHVPLSEKSSEKSSRAPELLPELLLLSDSSELLLKAFEALDHVDVPSAAGNQTVFALLPPAELNQDLNASRLEITDRHGSGDDNNGFGEGYESDDGYDEEGHSDLETGSPIQGNEHADQEVEEAREALIHAPEEHDILSATAKEVPGEQPHSILHVPPSVLAENGEVGSLPVTTKSIEGGSCLVTEMHEESSATTEPENSSEHLCKESGSYNGLEDLKQVSRTNEADRICIPGTAIGEESLLVGTGIDKGTPNLGINTEKCEERGVPSVDATLGDERSEVLSDRNLHREESLPGTEMQGERFIPFTKTHEKSSPVAAASEFGEEGHEERSSTDVTKTDEETQQSVTNSSLQKGSGNTLSREISMKRGGSAITTHNHKEKLIIPTTEVLEQTGCHDIPFFPKHEEGSSIPASEELCLDDAAGLQAHIELPVAEPVLSLCA